MLKQSWLSLTLNERTLQLKIERLEAFRERREKALLSRESHLQQDALQILHMFRKHEDATKEREEASKQREIELLELLKSAESKNAQLQLEFENLSSSSTPSRNSSNSKFEDKERDEVKAKRVTASSKKQNINIDVYEEKNEETEKETMSVEKDEMFVEKDEIKKTEVQKEVEVEEDKEKEKVDVIETIKKRLREEESNTIEGKEDDVEQKRKSPRSEKKNENENAASFSSSKSKSSGLSNDKDLSNELKEIDEDGVNQSAQNDIVLENENMTSSKKKKKTDQNLKAPSSSTRPKRTRKSSVGSVYQESTTPLSNTKFSMESPVANIDNSIPQSLKLTPVCFILKLNIYIYIIIVQEFI